MAAAFSSVCAVFQSTHPVRGATAPTCAPHRAPRHFNPRTPCGVRRADSSPVTSAPIFQSTHPVRGATKRSPLYTVPLEHFNPRTPCGVRRTPNDNAIHISQFQSTHPVRGATALAYALRSSRRFQSTHPVRGATYVCRRTCGVTSFQSTHPVRGATRQRSGRSACRTYFNPRTPCGVRPAVSRYGFREHHTISIHAPRAGCDSRTRPSRRHWTISIHAPRAGCDEKPIEFYFEVQISIHAPRAGCDRSWGSNCRSEHNFNPRTPCGVRRRISPISLVGLIFQSTHPVRGATNVAHPGSREHIKFQSTHPVRGATDDMAEMLFAQAISIHAPRAGCDPQAATSPWMQRYFNPRTPCGVRLVCQRMIDAAAGFQSTHPVRGATAGPPVLPAHPINFNPRTPCGVRPTSCSASCRTITYFNPRTPCGVRQTNADVIAANKAFQSTHPVRGATANLTILTR